MPKLTFLGATGTVTGSRFHLEIEGKNLLIDCGMFQGPKKIRLKNWEEFPVPPSLFDYVLLTHAHIDHSGYLPKFVREGFNGKIICTHATAELCKVMLKDSAHIQEEDAKWANKKGFSKHSPALPLYTTEDAEKAIKLFAPVHYGDHFKLTENTRIKFHDSGHILGSALIDIKTKINNETRKILFSGDLGRPEIPVLNEPDQVYNVDYLILESTYGNRLHESSEPIEELVNVIKRSMDRGGSLTIPAFSVGRTQTLLFLLRLLEAEGKIPSYPIFVDSPMAIEALQIFENHIQDFDLFTRMQNMAGKDIFRPRNLHICRSKQDSMSINDHKSGCIIISASGMVTGGRIVHHLKQRLPDPKNTVLLIGYQAIGTRGRTIMEKKETVKIHGKEIPINAQIEMIDGFSGHADYNEMLAWLMPFNKSPRATFLVHGEENASEAMAEKIKQTYHWNVKIPQFGESFELE
ncbi:MAG: MBL fold metallo-hydrolase [Candidatus Cloacimonetes bacterium]|nr:MBL fold metallo-hydrolase [Candidatus Cloacimonadota bacterium]MCF7815376.1 MBL fold metallo-hydrolase [Candidatus Cloacimonadota bacterium]MCF7869469.1 MBL fold metallo-hydrolase [Candidatus Cloacimonadota bacterium]MCF7884836.1 MBL fold metallo-hydrolase [Candidatus Cloacimonadota bacterium]